jgi:hypothetical protein
VSFTLSGFSTLKREGLDLPAEFTATVNGELTVGALAITVSGEAPTVDLRSSRARVQFAQETLLVAARHRPARHTVGRSFRGPRCGARTTAASGD